VINMPEDKVDRGWGRRKELLFGVFQNELTRSEAIAKVEGTYGVKIEKDYAKKLISKLMKEKRLERVSRLPGERHARYRQTRKISQPVTTNGLASDSGSSPAATGRQIEALDRVLERMKRIPSADLDPFSSRPDIWSDQWPQISEWLAKCGREGRRIKKKGQDHEEIVDEFFEARGRLVKRITSTIESELGSTYPYHPGDALKKNAFSRHYVRMMYDYALAREKKDERFLAWIREPFPVRECADFLLYGPPTDIWIVVRSKGGLDEQEKARIKIDFNAEQERVRKKIMNKLEEPEIAFLAREVLMKYKEVSEIRSEIDKGLKDLRHRIEWNPELLRNGR